MRLPPSLVKGRLIKRYKRFLADVRLDSGETVTAHCPNPGAMLGVAEADAPVWLSHHDDAKRKLKYSWQLIEIDGGLVGINTQNPNQIAYEAVSAGRVKELGPAAEVRREVRYGDEKSRIDLLLVREDGRRCFVEVKNVHLKRQAGLAEFPDSVTARGAKHLRELARVVEAGDEAVMLYIVQREDCESFALAADIDAKYAQAMTAARASGVRVLCYDCSVTTDEIALRRAIKVAI